MWNHYTVRGIRVLVDPVLDKSIVEFCGCRSFVEGEILIRLPMVALWKRRTTPANAAARNRAPKAVPERVSQHNGR